MKLKTFVFKGVLLLLTIMLFFVTFLITIQMVTGEKLELTLAMQIFYGTILLTDVFALSALSSVYRMVTLIGHKQAFSHQILPLVAKLNRQLLLMSLSFCGILPFVYQIVQNEDAPGVMILGLMLVAIPFSLVVFGKIVEELFKQAVNLKKEQDLTI
ncbi:DUF2975 domain-containing protein [Enterococcus sp.]|uniref:DUF2975 domain-containing protein n=1 Tax=Enterococcus sp. TaxID=35783 RepID=UPI002FC781E1